MPKRLSAEIEREVHRLAAKGRTLREIGQMVECSRHAVTNILGRERRSPDRSEWVPGPGRLTVAEREEIRAGLERHQTLTAIARALGRSVSTISREVAANGGRNGYRAWAAHRRAAERVRRPKATRLSHQPLAETVTEWLERWWSPEEIAQRLPIDRPHEDIDAAVNRRGRGTGQDRPGRVQTCRHRAQDMRLGRLDVPSQ